MHSASGHAPHGVGAHIALAADHHAELRNVIAACRFDDGDQVGFSRRQIEMLDVDAHFLPTSRAAAARLGASFKLRNPCSVQFMEMMKVGMALLLLAIAKRGGTGAFAPV